VSLAAAFDRELVNAFDGPPYARVDVIPDTPAWEQERTRTLGASEVPAVLGLSPYATPLDVYRGEVRRRPDMDPELAFIGHAEELVIGKWLRAFRPELGVIRRGFMARSLEHPWLHASFDRFLVKRAHLDAVQMKTAHQYAGADWEDEQVPLAVQAQVQTELLVHGAERGYAVAFVGGRRFHLHPIDRDEEFLQDLLIPQTRIALLGGPRPRRGAAGPVDVEGSVSSGPAATTSPSSPTMRSSACSSSCAPRRRRRRPPTLRSTG
jgi:putative phage-type endonuclease